MLPKINGVGTLTREPEIRYTAGGSAIVNFTLAFNERFKTKQGEQKENVNFIDCVVFGALGEKVVIPYVHKGDKLFISGKLKLEQWQAQDGSKRSKHSIQIEELEMIGNKSNNAQTNQAPQNGYSAPQQPPNNGYISNNGEANSTPQQPSIPEIDINSEDIPF